MTRHREKDEEAGGEGLGKLLTRKRLWQDSTGAIVSKKRPEHDKKRKRSSASRRDAPSKEQLRLDSNVCSSDAAILSPPESRHSISNHSSDTVDAEKIGHAQLIDPSLSMAQWPLNGIDTSFSTDPWPDDYDFLCNASWRSQPSQTDIYQNNDLPCDDIFTPDTGELSYRLTYIYLLNSFQLAHSICRLPPLNTTVGFLTRILRRWDQL
jgi:hypothetical protein